MIRIVNDDAFATAGGTRIEHARTGEAIHGVRKAVVTFNVDQPPIAEIEVFVQNFGSEAVPVFHATDPKTGETKQVRRIEFADGSRWENPSVLVWQGHAWKVDGKVA